MLMLSSSLLGLYQTASTQIGSSKVSLLAYLMLVMVSTQLLS